MRWLLTAHVRRYHRHYRSSGHVWQGRFNAFPIQQDDHLLRGTPYGSADRVSPTAAQLGLSASLRPRRPTEKRTGNIECLLISPLRPGTYLRIIVEGAVGAGDEIRIIERPAHDLTIRDIFRIYTRDREEVERLLAVPASRRAGGDGRNIFSRKRKVGAHTRLLLDVADIQ